MLNSEALEIGIGMAFLFLLVSLICTGIQEWIEGIFKWRAMDLERALRTLLDDKDGQLAAHLFAHPTVSALFQGSYDPSKLTNSSMTRWMTGGANAKHMALGARRNLPSYIPSTHFATALIDLVARGPVDATGDAAPLGTVTMADVRARAAALESPFLRRALLTAIDHAAGDLERLTQNVQRWFDGSMDRASGWYKRRAQSVLFSLGLLAAIVLNVDALYVMGRLTADKTFRDVVVNAAAKAQAPASASAPAGDPLAQVVKARELIEQVGMPVGWRDAGSGIAPLQTCDPAKPKNCEDNGYPMAKVVLGWLITAFAVMLGAPFWFDVLNKFMVIRSTVKPHEKSREEGSEDRADPDKAGQAQVATGGTGPGPNPGSGAAPAPGPAPGPGGSASEPAQEPFVPHQWKSGVTNPQEVNL